MPRKAYNKGLEKRVFNRTDNPFGKSRCWHCGLKLDFKRRKGSDGFGAWNMDHYPVPFRDIETQYCCGIMDSNDYNNIVPSCISCNIGHHYERSNWYYCGRSQICCTKKCVHKIQLILLLILTYILGLFSYPLFYN